MSVSAYIHKRLADLLEESRVVVWYDGEGTMRALAMQFTAPHCQRVDTSESTLKSRRERGLSTPEVIQRMSPSLLKVAGARLFLQSGGGIRAGGRQGNGDYQYTVQADTLEDLLPT